SSPSVGSCGTPTPFPGGATVPSGCGTGIRRAMLDHEVDGRRASMYLAGALDALLVTAEVAALAPLLAALLPGPRIPQVVVLLAGGVLIGPEVLGWADRAEIDLLANVGLGFLFLLAGYDLDPQLFGARPRGLAI